MQEILSAVDAELFGVWFLIGAAYARLSVLYGTVAAGDEGRLAPHTRCDGRAPGVGVQNHERGRGGLLGPSGDSRV